MPAQVLVDGEIIGATNAADQTLQTRVAPGDHIVQADDGHETWKHTVSVAAGKSSTLSTDLASAKTQRLNDLVQTYHGEWTSRVMTVQCLDNEHPSCTAACRYGVSLAIKRDENAEFFLGAAIATDRIRTTTCDSKRVSVSGPLDRIFPCRVLNAGKSELFLACEKQGEVRLIRNPQTLTWSSVVGDIPPGILSPEEIRNLADGTVTLARLPAVKEDP
jgi:hypothetical protein